MNLNFKKLYHIQESLPKEIIRWYASLETLIHVPYRSLNAYSSKVGNGETVLDHYHGVPMIIIYIICSTLKLIKGRERERRRICLCKAKACTETFYVDLPHKAWQALRAEEEGGDGASIKCTSLSFLLPACASKDICWRGGGGCSSVLHSSFLGSPLWGGPRRM